MAKEIKVIKDKILVKRIDKTEEQKQTKMFVVTENNQISQYEGTVLKIGTGVKDDPMEVNVGDTVIFHKNGSYKIDVESEEYYVISQSQVIAILN